ncbi:MAG: 1,4-alpha-glucan branching protein GlgB [Alteromonadaceae bacterium]|nr:1,4-alpha-glucan branching protein GlgB [Alteromonadaceae bacterium]
MTDYHHLVQGRASYPFNDLGVFRNELGDFCRVYIPGAIAVNVVDAQGAQVVELTAVGDGVFCNAIASQIPKQYRLKVQTVDTEYTIVDPYAYKNEAYHAVHFVDHAPQNVYRQLGAQAITLHGADDTSLEAVRFAVFAPNASAVSVIGEFNHWNDTAHPMQKTDMGYWVLVIPSAHIGQKYKFALRNAQGERLPHKADPIGFYHDQYPSHASVIFDHSSYVWNDSEWRNRQNCDPYSHPISIYEVQLASWRRPVDGRRYLSYRELAQDLVAYVKDMGYTHIECMPISEYPFDGSWGYQPVGLFAPTSRFGTPDDFKYFVDTCHQAGIGVIIDWVPAHFPEDDHGLAKFDGSCVYEYEDPRKGWHPDWNSCIYDFGKDEVRQFLVANALYWCEHFHIDGLRVDAVASMLYLDYSRNDGEWIPNVDGGNHNYEAISLLQWMNRAVYEQFPNVMTIAEESTSFAKVSRPVDMGGLGFGFKWNMGWMHDSLQYISRDSAHRKYHHNEITFSMVYAFDENFVLPISHDEVVYGKGSLLNKMPGDDWQQRANLRTYASFMFTHPGKKLNFMGCELGQYREWDHDGQLDWYLLDEPKHLQIQQLYRDLNHLYRNNSALHEQCHTGKGFRWLSYDDDARSIVCFSRHSDSGQIAVVLCNFTPIPHSDYVLEHVPDGEYQVVFNSDAAIYGGSDYFVPQAATVANGHLVIALPPLACVVLVQQ